MKLVVIFDNMKVVFGAVVLEVEWVVVAEEGVKKIDMKKMKKLKMLSMVLLVLIVVYSWKVS